MWIRNENEATQRLKVPDSDEFVDFGTDGKARVTADVGEQLAAAFDVIEIVERESSTSEEAADETDAEADGVEDADEDTE